MERRIQWVVLALLFPFLWGMGDYAWSDVLTGITWRGGISATLGLESTLVAFDPELGTLQRTWGEIGGAEHFHSLTYDPYGQRLFALSQSTHQLYSISLQPFRVRNLGTAPFALNADLSFNSTSLAYDFDSDILYFVARVDYWPFINATYLGTMDPSDKGISIIGPLGTAPNDFHVTGLTYSQEDRVLYGLVATVMPGASSLQDIKLCRIDPDDASVEPVLDLGPAHLHGLALQQGTGLFYSWANIDTGHYFVAIDLETLEVRLLGSSDPWEAVVGPATGPVLAFAYGNQPPKADAGDSQIVDEGVTVTLDGSRSVDPVDGIASFAWEQLDGPSVEIRNSQSQTATFVAPNVDLNGATLTFRLTLTDSIGLQAADEVSVMVREVPPKVDIKAAGQDGPVTVATDESVNITISVDPMGYHGYYADWWLVAATPFGVFSYRYPSAWTEGICFAVQFPLFSLEPAFAVLDGPLPPGEYTFFFGIDNNADGNPDGTWLDFVTVRVGE